MLSTSTRVSVLAPSLVASRIALSPGHVGTLALLGLAWALFVSGTAAFVVESRVISNRPGGTEQLSSGLLLAGAVSGVALGLYVHAPVEALVLLCIAGVTLVFVAYGRATLVRRGETLVPYSITVVRDLPLAAGWLLVSLSPLPSRLRADLVVACLAIAPLGQLIVLRARRGLGATIAHGVRESTVVLAAGFALHSGLGLVARLSVARASSAASLVLLETADRVAYTVVSGALGSLGTEFQRRWVQDVDPAAGAREARLLASIVAALGAAVGLGLATVGSHWFAHLLSDITTSSWWSTTVAMGLYAGCGGVLTILVRWELAHGYGRALGRRLLVAGALGTASLTIMGRLDVDVSMFAVLLASYSIILSLVTWRSMTRHLN